MSKPSGTVFVVDDDADVRHALGRLLRCAKYDVRVFAGSAEFLAAHDPEIAGCVILDLAMPAMNGLEVQASLAASATHRPVIFLSGRGTISTSVTAMRAGAVTFLTKPVEPRELFAAVEEALRADAAERTRGALHQEMAARLATLTPRERQVFNQVVAGRLNKQIAGDLGTAVKTIKVQRSRVMRKMGARSLAHLVRFATTVGLVSASSEQSSMAPRTCAPSGARSTMTEPTMSVLSKLPSESPL
jgi:FixJ family two-component response regulator